LAPVECSPACLKAPPFLHLLLYTCRGGTHALALGALHTTGASGWQGGSRRSGWPVQVQACLLQQAGLRQQGCSRGMR
jgi:hypothetical protein